MVFIKYLCIQDNQKEELLPSSALTSTTTQLRADIRITLQFSNRLIGCATDPPNTYAAQPTHPTEKVVNTRINLN